MTINTPTNPKWPKALVKTQNYLVKQLQYMNNVIKLYKI
jgi:hypothetical protein